MTNLLAAAKQIEKRLRSRKIGSKVLFFDSHEAYQEAVMNGEIHNEDICFINDVPDEDLDEAIKCLEEGEPIPEDIQQKIDHERSVFNNPNRQRFDYLTEEELKSTIEKYQ